MIKEDLEGIFLSIKVIPKASRNQIVGWENDFLKVRLAAVPEKGEANEALIAFLSKILGIAKSQISLISGHTSRQKRLYLKGITLKKIRQHFNHREY